MKLEFGNQDHIDYSRAKPLQNLKAWIWHECDCENCTEEQSTCPSCGRHERPEGLDHEFYHLLKCKSCGETAFNSDYDRHKAIQLIYRIENPIKETANQ